MTDLRVGVVGNPRYRELATVLGDLSREATARGIRLCTESRLAPFWPTELPELHDEPLDVLLTFGGDGTLLRGVRLLHGAEVPVLGVNLGRVGFLTTATRDTLPDALDALVQRTFYFERRLAITATLVDRHGHVTATYDALNEITIHKGGLARVTRLNVLIDGDNAGPYSGDGILVATPTGSTAYNLSAGGPILFPGVEAMVVSPICAHSLAVRPLVVHPSACVTVEPMAGWSEELMVSIDGQSGTTLAEGSRVDIRRAGHAVCLVHVGQEGFVTTMRRKLHWGDLSEREQVR